MAALLALVAQQGIERHRHAFASMMEAACFKGPTSWQTWTCENAGLLLWDAPLASIFCRPSENPAQVCLTLDGYLTQKNDLIAQLGLTPSCPFNDGQLIAMTYSNFGIMGLQRLRGDFAFALWDPSSHRLVAMREATGGKTLYYAQKQDLLLVATDERQIAIHPLMERRISRDALIMWAANLHDTRLAMYDGCTGLGRGQILIAEQGNIRIVDTWPPSTWPKLILKSDEDYISHFRHLLEQSVEDALPPEISHFGSALSGGMDSGSITATAAQIARQRKQTLTPFSFKFDQLHDCDESPMSLKAARALDLRDPVFLPCESHWTWQSAASQLSNRSHPTLFYDELNSLGYRILAEKGGQIWLTGHGGDTILRGISRLAKLANEKSAWSLLLAPTLRQNGLREWLKLILYYYVWQKIPPTWKLKTRKWAKLRTRRSWLETKPYLDLNSRCPWLAQPTKVFQEIDRQTLFELVDFAPAGVRRARHYEDRLAAPYGISCRHPFFDRRLIDFVLSIPPEKLKIGHQRKGLLRQSFKDNLPPEIIQAKKEITLISYYRLGYEKERVYIQELTQNMILAQLGIVNQDRLARAVAEYYASPAAKTLAFFHSALSLEHWLRLEITKNGFNV